MATAMMSSKGENLPEYLAIKKNYIHLVSVLKVNESDALQRLIQAGMISPPAVGSIPEQHMIDSVLQCVTSNAMKFYTFVSVLNSLSNTADILTDLRREFLCKG